MGRSAGKAALIGIAGFTVGTALSFIGVFLLAAFAGLAFRPEDDSTVRIVLGVGAMSSMAALAAIARYGFVRKALIWSLVAVAGAVAVAVAVEGAVAGAVVMFQLYVAWRVRKKDNRFAILVDAAASVRAIGGTRFSGASLQGGEFRRHGCVWGESRRCGPDPSELAGRAQAG